MTDIEITRQQIIDAFRELPAGCEISTKRLALRTGCNERAVRAAVSWLVLGGLVEESGTYTRRDACRRKYKVKHYKWTGRDNVRRVNRNPSDRSRIVITCAADRFLYAPRKL